MKDITIRKLREKRGWTQEQLEELSGVDQRTISDIETGRVANPGWNAVKKLAAAFDVDPRTLTFGQERVA